MENPGLKSEKGKLPEVKPPAAQKIPLLIESSGRARIDDYYWMRNRDSSEVLGYLSAENFYADRILQDSEELRNKIFNEIVARIKKDDVSVPYKENGYYYYHKYVAGEEYPVYCRKRGSLDSGEEVILDVNRMARGYEFYQAVGLRVSPSNKILAFGVDTLGRRKYEIHFKDLSTGELLKDKLPNTTGSVAWAGDNRTVFYAVKDDSLRPFKIMRHKLGTPAEEDIEVYREDDETFAVHVYKSKSDKVIFIGSYSTLSTEYRFIDADEPESEFKIIQPRQRDHEYLPVHEGDTFFIVTNRNAKNFKLMSAPVSNPCQENWKEIVPHSKDVLLESIEVFSGFLALQERKDGQPGIRIINRKDDSEHSIVFEDAAYTAYFGDNAEIDTELLRFKYTSLSTPYSTFDHNMRTGEKNLLKTEEIVGGYNAEEYMTEKLYAPAADGTKIPISLVYKKRLKKDEGNPLLLYGYGAYGISVEPAFNSARVSLLDRGFIFAIAHVRGGQELGREWYEGGKLLRKKNTFTDFIACAELLIDLKYTNKDKLFAMGGSAGGLLIGAVANMRPDLFKGMIAAVPFVDVVTTMLDETIPLTTGEYDEWGNPNIPEYYDYILSYSPYDNIEEKEYPGLLVTAGLHDSQVQYWEPAKWVAKLRAMKKDDNLLLLKTDMSTGHSGASGRFEKQKLTSMEYSFMLRLLNIKE